MELEERILMALKDFGRLPTSRVSGICKIDYMKVAQILNKMAEDGKILKEKETVAIYWRLKDEI